MFVVLKQGGRTQRGIKIIAYVLLLLTVLLMLGGCWLLNEAPVAVISANPTSGEAPLEVTFDASESYDPDGDEISYEWMFSDGGRGAGPVIQHVFTNPESYVVELSVRDNRGGNRNREYRH